MNKKMLLSLAKNPAWKLALLVISMLVLAACQPAAAQKPVSESSSPTATTAPIAEPTMATATEAVINVVVDPKLGSILVGDKGMTLYMYTTDGPDQSNCTGDCLVKWPPLLTQGNPKLGDGVDASLVGTATLADGSKIVTYNKMPLYYWFKDTKPGDTTGQGVGSVWFVVSPEGKVVGKEAAAASVPPTATPAAAKGGAGSSSASEAILNVVADPKLGNILVGDNGMTLYMYTKDGPDQSNCTGDCLVKWPPLLTQGSPVLGEGVDDSLIGTATLADGSKIVTYNKMPLYYWFKDTKPGDTTGQGVGEVWYVVSPDGKPVTQ
jgi:predicted lipoprotein with Yx(FWY)xxD motif